MSFSVFCVNLSLFCSICKTAGSHSLSQLVVTWRQLCCSFCFQHFYEWLRLHNERGSERADSSPPHLSTLSTATLNPTGCGHPWSCYTSMTNKPGHGWSEEVYDGMRRFCSGKLHKHTGITILCKCSCCNLFSRPCCPLKFPWKYQNWW